MTRKLAYTSVVVSVAVLSGCSHINKTFDNEGDGSYADSSSVKAMEVPPDLTSPEYDSTFIVNAPNTSVSAEGLNRQVRNVGVSDVEVLPDEVGLKMQGTGEQRYLEVAMPARSLWPRVVSFWSSSGATMKRNEPAVGIMETDWIEYQEKMPKSRVNSLFRGVFKNGWDSGYRDRYLIRFEKASPQSTRIFMTHRGAELTTSDTGNKWESRPSSSEKAAEMLNRLKDYLRSGKAEKVYLSRDKPSTSTPEEKKKLFGIFNVGEPEEEEVSMPGVSRTGSTLRLTDTPQNVYASVGGALSRTGFVIDGKDATKGLYAAKWTGQGKKSGLNIFKKDNAALLPTGSKYVIKVSGSGSGSVVTVLDEKGQLKSGEQAQAVLDILRKDLAR
ncbi:MAG: NlpBDapX family lipoprotein [uncultured Thiotrichaceae bacterium]|uniref:NlpBDapX family lipoprotein n=1 Tax=uncultured Thiotrichaceae bacterium TaxID=298394 RepID=A0A6S6TQZ7_9GAMM|nr:MAG: NlpBDapX family lipoprotein [uncultured Thiotrichaceae bacterium]